jgi:Zn-dependent M32 family carboxypeptidase
MHIILRYEMERALIRGDLAVEDVSTVACFLLLQSPNTCCQGVTLCVACGACRLFSYTLSQPQVPKVWNAKMEEYLGVTPANDAQGCLQDVHWSAGRE